MRKFLLAIGMSLLLTGSLLAVDGEFTSLDFSTRVGSEFAWDLRWTGSEWVMSFVDDAIVVDDSNPDDADLESDFVLLPTMRLTKVSDEGGYLTATLTPTEALEIESYPGMANVLRAATGLGNTLVIGTTHVAYSTPQDDLDIISANHNYGKVIPKLADEERRGFDLDLSFTGDAIGAVNLYDLIISKKGSARGTISGQITAIPEPATLAILCLGTAAVARLRSKKHG
jgi:hypothetical protein